jgi:hypothetical protein
VVYPHRGGSVLRRPDLLRTVDAHR